MKPFLVEGNLETFCRYRKMNGVRGKKSYISHDIGQIKSLDIWTVWETIGWKEWNRKVRSNEGRNTMSTWQPYKGESMNPDV